MHRSTMTNDRSSTSIATNAATSDGTSGGMSGVLMLLDNPDTSVHQDDFSPARGNALQACVASLFGQPLSNVPNFIAAKGGYERAIKRYLEGHKYFMVKRALGGGISRLESLKLFKGQLCIVRGKSPRGDFGHVVIARIRADASGFDMIHDPHPEAKFLDTTEEYGWYMIFSR